MEDTYPLDQVVAYRAFDLRNRFPEPLSSFREALERLQSDDAYMPDVEGSIVAYLKDGVSIPFPDCFYWVREKRFKSREEAETWARKRQKKLWNYGQISDHAGNIIDNPRDPIDIQIERAANSTFTQVISPQKNDVVSRQAMEWLRCAIQALPPRD